MIYVYIPSSSTPFYAKQNDNAMSNYLRDSPKDAKFQFMGANASPAIQQYTN